MSALRDAVLVAAGCVLVLVVVDASLRTFVLPRPVAVRLTRLVTVCVRRAFDLRVRFARTYEARDRVMGMFAPIALATLVAVWLVLLLAAFTLIFAGIEGAGWRDAFTTAGSSIFTLGFERPAGLAATGAAFAAAAVGLALLAMVIAYLPTIYAAFSRREALVAGLSMRAGTPPAPVELLVRAHRIGRLDDLSDVWVPWQGWFAELEETHTSLAFLNFLRSPRPERSWITAAGAVLDAAALVNSTVDVPWQPMGGLLVLHGYSALREIADFFRVPYPRDPAPDDPISVTRGEWEDVCRELEAAGVPLKADRDQAWRDFAGWRVNYDQVLVTLAGLLAAPYAPWSSDRSIPFRVRALTRRPRRGA